VINEVITDFGGEFSAPGPQPSHSRSVCASAPFRDAIELGRSRGRNAMAIWQDLVDTCGFSGSCQSVQRFVRKLHPSHSPEACAVIETAAGEERETTPGFRHPIFKVAEESLPTTLLTPAMRQTTAIQ